MKDDEEINNKSKDSALLLILLMTFCYMGHTKRKASQF